MVGNAGVVREQAAQAGALEHWMEGPRAPQRRRLRVVRRQHQLAAAAAAGSTSSSTVTGSQ